jgi:hypothetical protein
VRRAAGGNGLQRARGDTAGVGGARRAFVGEAERGTGAQRAGRIRLPARRGRGSAPGMPRRGGWGGAPEAPPPLR